MSEIGVLVNVNDYSPVTLWIISGISLVFMVMSGIKLIRLVATLNKKFTSAVLFSIHLLIFALFLGI
jgi:hypothetical protein